MTKIQAIKLTSVMVKSQNKQKRNLDFIEKRPVVLKKWTVTPKNKYFLFSFYLQ